MRPPPDTSANERRAAVLSLARIRALESAPGEDGLKSLWHPGAASGADLATYLDGRGRVQRQELILLGDFFLWTRGAGLRTGAVMAEPSAAGGPLAASVTFDAAPLAVRILRADAALAGYRGSDRALLHVQEVVRQARQRVGGPPPPPAAPAPRPTGVPLPAPPPRSAAPPQAAAAPRGTATRATAVPAPGGETARLGGSTRWLVTGAVLALVALGLMGALALWWT